MAEILADMEEYEDVVVCEEDEEDEEDVEENLGNSSL